MSHFKEFSPEFHELLSPYELPKICRSDVQEVSSNFDDHTTSFDGFVLASNPKIKRVFQNFNPMGRLDILQASSEEILDSLREIK